MAVLDFSKAFDTVPQRLVGETEPLRDKWTDSRLDRGLPWGQGAGGGGWGATLPVSEGLVWGPAGHCAGTITVPHSHKWFAVPCPFTGPFVCRRLSHVSSHLLYRRPVCSSEGVVAGEMGGYMGHKKCQIITLARGRGPFIHFYTLCNHILESVSDAKYLGILVSNDLSWSPHINSVFNWANSTLGFLRRNFRRCPAPLKETAYITLVHSIMEYAVPIWDPHLSKDSHMLENIQRRTARFIKGDFRTNASVTKMLQELGLKDLKDRRRDLRLALLF